MKKQPAITDATREKFVAVFCDFYMERPIEKITVKDISEKAGYSRTTFYNYFKDPYEVLEYIENEYISYLEYRMVSNIQKNNGLKNFILLFAEMVREKEMYSQVLLCNPYNISFIHQLKTKLLPPVLDAFGMSAENKKAIYVFEFYITGVVSVISRWMQKKEELSLEQLGELIEGILKQGVLSQLK